MISPFFKNHLFPYGFINCKLFSWLLLFKIGISKLPSFILKPCETICLICRYPWLWHSKDEFHIDQAVEAAWYWASFLFFTYSSFGNKFSTELKADTAPVFFNLTVCFISSFHDPNEIKLFPTTYQPDLLPRCSLNNWNLCISPLTIIYSSVAIEIPWLFMMLIASVDVLDRLIGMLIIHMPWCTVWFFLD